MNHKFLAVVVVIAALASGTRARADQVGFEFSGAGVSGSGTLTVTPDTVVNDPAGAYTITGITGTFSDSNLSPAYVNETITGLYAINPIAWMGPPYPVSMSLFAATNLPPQDSAISYDNLFYPDGSPVVCGLPGGRGIPGRVRRALHSPERERRRPLEQWDVRGRAAARLRRRRRERGRQRRRFPIRWRHGRPGARLPRYARDRPVRCPGLAEAGCTSRPPTGPLRQVVAGGGCRWWGDPPVASARLGLVHLGYRRGPARPRTDNAHSRIGPPCPPPAIASPSRPGSEPPSS